ARVPAATPGIKRITVPASPASTVMSPVVVCISIGVTFRTVGSPSTWVNCAPKAVSASIIRSVSRETKTPRSCEGLSAKAASTRCRLVNDFDPGSVTVAFTGAVVNGADQSSPGAGVARTNRDLFRVWASVAPSKIPCLRCGRGSCGGTAGNIYNGIPAVNARRKRGEETGRGGQSGLGSHAQHTSAELDGLG